MNNLFILKQFASAKVFAAVTIVSLILSAFPAAFLVANAANTDAVGTVAVFIAASPTTGNSEYVQVKFTGTGTLDLEGWTISDEVGLKHTFPSGVTLISDDTYNVCGDSSLPVVCDAEIDSGGNTVWNNSGDTMTLRDETDTVVHVVTWSSTTEGELQGVGEGSAIDYSVPPACAPQFDAAGVTDIQNTTTGDYFDTVDDALDDCDTSDNDVIELLGDITTDKQITLDRPVVFDGNDFTVDAAFTKTDNDNNSAIGVIGTTDVAIKDVVLDGTNGTDLHGLNVYESIGVSVENVTSQNFRSGMVVNGSTVDASDFSTAGNAWHGINVAPGSGVTDPSVLNISNTSMHDEFPGDESNDPVPHIFTDNINAGSVITVNDIDDQYDVFDIPLVLAVQDSPETLTRVQTVPTARAYFLKEAVDVCSNLDGPQEEVPEGYELIKDECVPIELPVCEIGENLLENASFEEPEVTNSSKWQKFASVTGWIIEKVSDDSLTTLEVMRGWSGNEAAEGKQYAELDGDHSTKLSQTVETLDGGLYELKWAFAPRHNIDAAQNQLGVSIDGSLVATEGPATASAGLESADWTRNSYTFTADGSDTKVTFSDAGPSNSFGTFLDDAALCLVREPEPSVTVHTSKIVCTDEADLPNWGSGGSNITETTAADWLAENDNSCELVQGWEFEWAPKQGTSNPGDTLVGPAGGNWTTFTGSVEIPVSALNGANAFWMREVLQEDYLPFTYQATGNSNDVTAEMYCHTDVKNYDNYDRVDNPEEGGDYYCVAWNVPEVEEPPIEYGPYCGDGIVNQSWEQCDGDVVNDDIDIIQECFFGPAEDECEAADFNDDDVVNAADLGLFKNAEQFDLSGDGRVDLNDNDKNADLNILKECFFGPAEDECEAADFNDDDVVNAADLGLFKSALEFDLSGDQIVDLRDEDAQCTDSCLLDNQCSMEQLVKITLDDTTEESSSFDGSIHLGGAGDLIPNGTWFSFEEFGDDSFVDTANAVDGLAVERNAVDGKLALAFVGDNARTNLDIVKGSIMTLGIDLGAIDRAPNPQFKLEDGSGNSFDDVFDKNGSSIDFDLRADTGNDGVTVEVNQGEKYNCEDCKAEVEARVILQDGEQIFNNGDGNLNSVVILGDGSTVPFGQWFKISEQNPGPSADWVNDSDTVTNYPNPADLDGLFVSREGNGQVKVALYGFHNPGGDTNYESLRATIQFNDTSVAGVTQIPGDFKIENHSETDGVVSNDDFDSFDQHSDSVDFDFWVDTKADGITITLGEVEYCDGDTEPEPEEEDKKRIYGYKYEGVYGGQTSPKSDWPIYLYNDETDDLVMSTTTNESGYYEFYVMDGEWRVEEGSQIGWEQVGVEQDDDYDFTADELEYCYFSVGQNDQEYLSVARVPFDDYNDDERIDGHLCSFYNQQEEQELNYIDGYKFEIVGDIEIPYEGWTIYATNGDVVLDTTTDELGYYYFEVPEGDWTINEDMPNGWSQVWVEQNGLRVARGLDSGPSSCLFSYLQEEVNIYELPYPDQPQRVESNDSQSQSCSFYNQRDQIPFMSISGYKYDVTGSEPVGAGGWTVYATNGEISTSTITNSNGSYFFDLPVDNWEVYEEDRGGWTQVSVEQNGLPVPGESDALQSCFFDYVIQSQTLAQTTNFILNEEVALIAGTCDFLNEQDEIITTNGGGGGSSSSGTLVTNRALPTPLVAGEAVSQCPFLEDFMQIGWDNDTTEVIKLQLFLNIFKGMFGGTDNPVTGVFDQTTDANVKAFQEQFRSEILDPWYERGIVPHNRPTGFVYKTTLWKINDIVCPEYAILPDFEGEDLTKNVDLN